MNAAISGRAYDLPGTPMNNKSVWAYLAEIIPILTAIIGGLWTLNLYLDQREKDQRAMSESARKEQETSNCSASLVADKLTSRRDVSCGGEGPWGVDFGCIVRQFVSEPHDDAARRSLHSFPFREGCLDCGPAG